MVELEDSFESLSIRLPKSKVDSQSIAKCVVGQRIAYGFHSRCLRKMCTWKQFLSMGKRRQDFDRVALCGIMWCSPSILVSLSVYLFTHRGKNDLSRKSRLFPLNCFDFELATIIIVRQFDNVSRSICTLNSLRTWFRQTIPFSPLHWPERVYMCVCVSTSIFRGNDERCDSMYGKMVCFSPYDNIENRLYT